MERDQAQRYTMAAIRYFNSHAHVERDKETVDVIKIIGISTHTLTWSVTRSQRTNGQACANFNSHAHVERDEKFWADIPGIYVFQLTRSRGA